MTTDNKTLADAQPGGRVSLYQERSTHVVYRGSCGNLPCYCWATEDHVVGDEVARYEAQPSLGGQGALPRYRCAGYDCSDEGSEENTGGPLMVADPSGEWVRASDALAARQPVRIYGCCAQPEGELHTAECPNMRHLAARQPVGELHLPADGFYKIVYDDAEVPDESFARTGALDAALRRFEQISARWNAHLFVRFTHNTSDCTVPNATPAQAVDLGELRRLSDGWLARSDRLSATQQRKAGAYWACAKELRDWLDSQAVGNG